VYYSYLRTVEHLLLNMPSQSQHPDTTPVLQNVRSLANCHNQKPGPSRNSQLHTAVRRVSAPGGEGDSSQRGCSVPSIIRGPNCTSSASLNLSRYADITQHVISTLSSTQRRCIITPTATPGTSSRNTPAPSGTIQTNSTHHIVFSPTSDIASTPTPLSSL
jgi:hypothetical protein